VLAQLRDGSIIKATCDENVWFGGAHVVSVCLQLALILVHILRFVTGAAGFSFQRVQTPQML
jgi:hypothetical protein